MQLNSDIRNEIIIRLIIVSLHLIIGLGEPLERKIQPEEIWLYRYPITKSYCTNRCLWSVVIFVPLIIILINYKNTKDKKDLEASLLTISLSIPLTCMVTRLLKFITGKPRPDFFWRCFPNGYANREMICHGNEIHIREGRQSFPSGHASISFAALGFVTLYLMGKLRVYELKGTGHSWRILACFLPILFASCISVSRISDYHHHPIDVLSGIILGIFITIICYHHYYPPFYRPSGDVINPPSPPPPALKHARFE